MFVEIIEFMGDALDEQHKDRPMKQWLDLRSIRAVTARWDEKTEKPRIDIAGLQVAYLMKSFEDAERVCTRLLDKIERAEYEDVWKRQAIASSLHGQNMNKSMQNWIDQIKKW